MTEKLYLIAHKQVSYHWTRVGYRESYVSSADYYKIGIASDPERRLNHMRVGTPHKLELVTTVECDDARAVEKELQSLLQNQHVRGEWYNLIIDHVNSFKGLDRIELETLSELGFEWRWDPSKYDRSLYVDIVRARKQLEKED